MARAAVPPLFAAGVLIGLAAALPPNAAAQVMQEGGDLRTLPTGGFGLFPSTAVPSAIGGLPGPAGLRQREAGQAPPPQPGAPAIQFTPSISASEAFDSNINRASSGARSDFITAISPRIGIQGQEPRATFGFSYAPTAEIYARTSSADNVAHRLAANATVTLAPDTAFVTIHGFAAVQPVNGALNGLGVLGGGMQGAALPVQGLLGNNQLGSAAIGNGNRSQDFGASVFPYVLHRFGSFGTAKVGASLTETIQNTTITNPSALLPGITVPRSAHQLTEEAVAEFETGEDFGRVRDLVLLDGSRSQGTGVLSGAASDLATDWFGYALNRYILPFGELGYEHLTYNTVQRTRISDAVWQIGVQLAPNPDSLITVGYGHHQGVNGFNAIGYYAVTARTRLTVNYTTGLTTDLQQIQSTLGLTGFDAAGNAVNVLTGAPLLLGNALLSLQSTLYHSHSLVMTASTTWERDQVTIGVQRQSQTPEGLAPGSSGPGLTQTSMGVFGSWLHQLSPVTAVSASAGIQNSTFRTTIGGSSRSIALSAGVSRQLGKKLSAIARYLYYGVKSDVPGQGYTENVLLVGVTRTF